MSFRWVKNRAIFIALLAILVTQFTVLVSADISGSVINADGAPVEAMIRVFEENREIAIFRTGSNGVFDVELSPGQYTLTVYADNVETPGFDYLPAVVEVDDGFDDEIVLGFGATLRFEGDFQYIDTENLPL
ncbi:MAG: carboxypeptidase-like regulatory domain-containing protein, partial [Candidatus Bathyarchaeota archaeon]